MLRRSVASAGPEKRGGHATEADLRAIHHYLGNNLEIGCDVKMGGETGMPPRGHNWTAKVAATCAVSALAVESFTQSANRPLSVP